MMALPCAQEDSSELKVSVFGGDVVGPHLVQQVQRQLPAAGLVTCRNQAAVCDDVTLAVLLHLRTQMDSIIGM